MHRLKLSLLLAALCSTLAAQDIQIGPAHQPRGKDHVHLISDNVEVKAGREQIVELRFRVDDGYHINSHTPKDELLIPTELQLNSGGRNGVDVLKETYPAGSSFRLKIGEGETLDVYQGEFRVQVRMIADPGSSTMTGVLRYQACDSSSCFPPRTLPVQVAVVGK
jgi:hypothetical protein